MFLKKNWTFLSLKDIRQSSEFIISFHKYLPSANYVPFVFLALKQYIKKKNPYPHRAHTLFNKLNQI